MSRKTPSGEKKEEVKDTHLDATLRPTEWQDYIGQEGVKKNLQVLLRAARERKHPPEHLLFYGPPGLGKTTLAHLIARAIEAPIKTTSGPAIEKIGDLAAILTNLAPHEVLFIDEVHRLSKSVEEVLYPALESGTLDIIIGKGPSARTIALELPPFTLVAATTRVAQLSAPLRSRFGGGVFRLEFYNDEEIEEILRRSAKLLNIDAEPAALRAIAIRSRATPRIANYLLKRCRDLAQIKKEKLTAHVADEALSMLGVDTLGLNESDRAFLTALLKKFGGGPVGLTTLGAAIAEEVATIEEVIEPYLLRRGLIERTSRGRVATAKAREHVGASPETLSF